MKLNNRTDIIWTTLRVAGQPLKMEVDTGSAYSVIPHRVYKEMFQKRQLQPTPVTLRTYMGELVVPEGKLRVQVKHKKQKVKLDLLSKAVDKCCLVVTGLGRPSSIGERSTP